MKAEFRLFATLALAGMLGACSKTSDPQTAMSLPPPPATARNAILNVAPGSVSGCGQDSWVTSRVSWRVYDHAVAHVQLVVADPGADTSNLFAKGGVEGNAMTEKWVRSGTRFVLSNADTGAELASYTVEGPGCGAAQ